MTHRVIPAVALLAACMVAASAPAFEEGRFAVLTARANVRSGPGTGYPVMTMFEEGRRVRVIDTSGDWFRVELPRPGPGWIYGPLLCPEPDQPVLRLSFFNLVGLPSLLSGTTPAEHQFGPVRPPPAGEGFPAVLRESR